METAKTRNLHADLGLANNKPAQGEIDLAYQKLARKLAPENNSAPGSTDAAELSKVDPAPLLAGLAPISSLSVSQFGTFMIATG
jgi:hypothetical protein